MEMIPLRCRRCYGDAHPAEINKMDTDLHIIQTYYVWLCSHCEWGGPRTTKKVYEEFWGRYGFDGE